MEKPTLVDWSLSIKQTEAARAKMDTEVPVSIYIYIYNMYNYIYIYITYFCCRMDYGKTPQKYGTQEAYNDQPELNSMCGHVVTV